MTAEATRELLNRIIEHDKYDCLDLHLEQIETKVKEAVVLHERSTTWLFKTDPKESLIRKRLTASLNDLGYKTSLMFISKNPACPTCPNIEYNELTLSW